jgi:hypothetical protein
MKQKAHNPGCPTQQPGRDGNQASKTASFDIVTLGNDCPFCEMVEIECSDHLTEAELQRIKKLIGVKEI